MFNGSGKITWIGKPGQSRKCRCTLRTSDLEPHKSLCSHLKESFSWAFKKLARFYQIIFNLRRFVAELKRKTNFDCRPIYRFVKIINLYPSRMQAMGRAGEGSYKQNIIDLVKNSIKCLFENCIILVFFVLLLML